MHESQKLSRCSRPTRVKPNEHYSGKMRRRMKARICQCETSDPVQWDSRAPQRRVTARLPRHILVWRHQHRFAPAPCVTFLRVEERSDRIPASSVRPTPNNLHTHLHQPHNLNIQHHRPHRIPRVEIATIDNGGGNVPGLPGRSQRLGPCA